MVESVDRFEVPIIPNRPLKFVGESESFGTIALRRNEQNGLVENGAFDPEQVRYDTDYQNNQALSASFEAHMRAVIEILKSRYPAGTKVVEVGCGKGDFLELLQAEEVFNVRGYDGAYEGSNPSIERRFLTSSDKIEADLVVLRHVLEHIQRPQDFLRLLAEVFEGAEIYVEVPDFSWIENNQSFFDITYEHVNYFTPQSLAKLFVTPDQQGLLFGDQYQFAIGRLDVRAHAEFGRAYDAKDSWSGLRFEDVFPNFENIIDAIETANGDRSIYIWGAATKGVMFCHHLKRLRPAIFDRIKAAVDINPMKAGRFMPSVQLPILDIDSLCREARGDELVMIMNPNYQPEIVAELQARGLEDVSHLCV